MYFTNVAIIPVNKSLSCLLSGFIILVLFTSAVGSRMAHANMPPPVQGPATPDNTNTPPADNTNTPPADNTNTPPADNTNTPLSPTTTPSAPPCDPQTDTNCTPSSSSTSPSTPAANCDPNDFPIDPSCIASFLPPTSAPAANCDPNDFPIDPSCIASFLPLPPTTQPTNPTSPDCKADPTCESRTQLKSLSNYCDTHQTEAFCQMLSGSSTGTGGSPVNNPADNKKNKQ